MKLSYTRPVLFNFSVYFDLERCCTQLLNRIYYPKIYKSNKKKTTQKIHHYKTNSLFAPFTVLKLSLIRKITSGHIEAPGNLRFTAKRRPVENR